MAIKKPRDGTPGMTDQSPRWEALPQQSPPDICRPRITLNATATRMAKI